MRAELKSIFSFDVIAETGTGDLRDWNPSGRDFGIGVTLFVGWQGDERSDAFDMFLCTPGFFAARVKGSQVETGQYVTFVRQFDYTAFEGHVKAFIERCEGPTWPDVARKVAYLARWEFNDFNTEASPRGVTQRFFPR